MRSNQTSMVGIFIFLTLLVALAAISGSGNYSEQTAQNPPDNGGPSSRGDGQQTSYFSTPESFLSLLPFVCILVLVFFLALRHMRADRILVEAKDQPSSEMSALQNAIHILNLDPDARSGILSTYAEMCTMLSDPGLEVSLTPKELERLVTDQLRWPKRPVHQLTELFQEARYSHHALEEEHKVMALDSLNELKTILEGRAHAQ